MKKTMLIFAMLIIVIGCKKKEVAPEPVIMACETKTKVFEGKYECMSDSKDTITIVFTHNNCPTEGVNTYSVYGLGKAYNNTLQSNLDVNKVYVITSNEFEKSAVTSGVNCKWGIYNALSVNYSTIGVVGFRKI